LLSVLDSSENPITSTAKVIIADQPSVVTDDNVLISGDISTISYQLNRDTESKPNTKTKSSKKLSSNTSKDNAEEQVDPSCLSYVKSTWEKYVNEIGTEKGPLRHVDEGSQEYPHLNGFVAFDMEHWWAERSISLINESKCSSASSSSSKIADVNNNVLSDRKLSDSISNLSSLSRSKEVFLSQSAFDKSLCLNLKLNYLNGANGLLGSKTKPPSSPPPLQNLNNFQICFS